MNNTDLKAAARHPSTIAVATCFALSVVGLIVAGYGRYVSAFWVFLLIPLLLLAGAISCVTRRRWHFSALMCSGVAALGLGWTVGDQLRLLVCFNTRDEIVPIIHALDAHRSQHQHYPAHLDELPEFAPTAQHTALRIGEGKFLQSGDIDISPLSQR